MRIFIARTRAFIENSVKHFADPEQQPIWDKWSSAHPQVRCNPDDPDDDGTGPMPEPIRALIIGALHKRYDHLMRQTRSPIIEPDEMVSLSNEAGTIYAIACSLSGSHNPWLSRTNM